MTTTELQLIEEKDIVVHVGTDLSALVATFSQIQKAFEGIAAVLHEGFAQLAKSLEPFMEEINKQIKGEGENDPSDTPKLAFAVTKHPEMNGYVHCPRCKSFDQLHYTIMHLNDEHYMSRWEIADWLDTLDSQPIFYPRIPQES